MIQTTIHAPLHAGQSRQTAVPLSKFVAVAPPHEPRRVAAPEQPKGQSQEPPPIDQRIKRRDRPFLSCQTRRPALSRRGWPGGAACALTAAARRRPEGAALVGGARCFVGRRPGLGAWGACRTGQSCFDYPGRLPRGAVPSGGPFQDRRGMPRPLRKLKPGAGLQDRLLFFRLMGV